MIWLILGVLLIWTKISVIYAITQLGHKNRKDRWYDYILFAPAMCIAYIIGLIARMRRDD